MLWVSVLCYRDTHSQYYKHITSYIVPFRCAALSLFASHRHCGKTRYGRQAMSHTNKMIAKWKSERPGSNGIHYCYYYFDAVIRFMWMCSVKIHPRTHTHTFSLFGCYCFSQPASQRLLSSTLARWHWLYGFGSTLRPALSLCTLYSIFYTMGTAIHLVMNDEYAAIWIWNSINWKDRNQCSNKTKRKRDLLHWTITALPILCDKCYEV